MKTKSPFRFVGALLALALAAILTTVPAYSQTGVIQSVLNVSNKVNTYRAEADAFTVASSPTDVFTISGSASKTTYIRSITISGIATTATMVPIRIAKRSTAGGFLTANALIAGVSNAVTNVPLDSQNTAAAATLLYFTGNMSTVGTLVGYIDSQYISVQPAAIFTGNGNAITYTFGQHVNQYPTLRSAAETLAVNMNGTTVTGAKLSISVEWMER